MLRQKLGTIEWLEFELLADIPFLKHAVFLRHGGTSTGSYHSLNASLDVGDKEENVQHNLERIQHILQDGVLHPIQLHWSKQCHGKDIEHVQEASPQESNGCDALVTALPGKALLIRHADCQAAIIYDTKHRIVANVHVGWRGSVHNMYKEIIQYMQKSFDSSPQELLICISPSLGPDDAEFIHYGTELPEEFWPFQVKPNFFDFWAISEYQIRACGVLPHHIEIARISTYSNPHDYFSYRRNKTTGRHATCALLGH